jgi:hypothetical protein
MPPPPQVVEEVPPAPDPGAHRHDAFFLQMQIGMSGFVYTPTPQRTPSGLGGGLDFSIGGALTEHLVLCGGFSFDGGGTLDSGPKYSSVLFGFSANVLYYLSSNFFFGGGAGLGGISAEDSNKDSNGNYANIGSTGPGLFLKAEFGHEWWVSANWALGIAIRGSFIRAKENNAGPYAPVWTGGTASLLFSATYD